MVIKANTIDETVDDVKKIEIFVKELLSLGDIIKNNSQNLEEMLAVLRRYELNSKFITVAEAAEALQCAPKKASEVLKQRGIEIIDAGKTHVVNKKKFIEAFEGRDEN